MKQKIAYLLKHNSAIQLIYRVVMSFFFKMLGHATKTDDNLVLFVSFMGMRFNDSPKTIYDYMQNNPIYAGYRCVWAFEKPSEYPSLETVKIDTPQYFITALKAKYWVTNTNIERGLRFKKSDQVYLNTWHGVTLKHIGNDCPGRKDFNFDNVDYLCVCSDYDESVFRTAFRALDKSYLRCGLPRNERLWGVTAAERQEVRNSLGLAADQTVILYAPTWRDSIDGGKTYQIKPPIHFDNWRKELGENYVVLFRAHHQTTKVLGVVFDGFVRDVSNYPDVNDLLISADILVTDYSAIAFDYSILCKPILCYAYDYDEYLSSRGTYFEMDERYPSKSCRDEKELLFRIRNLDFENECNNTRRFRDEFVSYGINSTEECVRALFGNPEELS